MPPKKPRALKRPQRATSNVFAMFDKSQILEFKEAFSLIDGDRNGFITVEDLKEMYASLGKVISDTDIEAMVKEAPGDINFTMFLTLFGEKLNGTDPEQVIQNAFACFDENNSGKIQFGELRDLLLTMGDRYSEDEVDNFLREAPLTDDGMLDYIEFTRILKHGRKDQD